MLIKKIKTSSKLLLANILVFLAFAMIVEIGGQIFYFLHPRYQDLCTVFHKNLGWKRSPNCHHIHTGGLFNAEFSVATTSNSYGFRDNERELTKPTNTIRIAFMGDSMVEALQVSFEKTAAQILETRLNEFSKNNLNYEVLNFGVGNYGIGQMFVAWLDYAQQFKPDLTIIFLTEYLFERTVENKILNSQKSKSLRPIFSLKNEKDLLDRFPNPYKQPINFVNKLAREELTFKPSKNKLSKERGKTIQTDGLALITNKRWFLNEAFKIFVKERTFNKKPNLKIRSSNIKSINGPTFIINMKIIDEFVYQIKANGGRPILLDAFKYYNIDEEYSSYLEMYSRIRNLGYINVSNELLQAENNGIRTRWKGDNHFNEAGQKIFGETIFEGILPYMIEF